MIPTRIILPAIAVLMTVAIFPIGRALATTAQATGFIQADATSRVVLTLRLDNLTR